MPSSNRSLSSQSKHDRKVLQIVMEYINKGYQIKADIPGYSKPGPILGYRPDIVASKGDHKTIIEVETPDSIGSDRDLAQQKAFRQAAEGEPKIHYKRLIAE